MASPLVAVLTALIVAVGVSWAVVVARKPKGAAGPWIFGVCWLGLPSAVALSGALQDFSSFPPPMMFVLAAVLATGLSFAFSPWGGAVRDRFSMAELIGFHVFRAMPELLLFVAYSEGLAPVQMTIEGRNWDALTAVLAFLIYLNWRDDQTGPPHWVGFVWSVIGISLLVNVVSIAVLSMPTPYRVFHNEPANTFVATFPYVLLPAVHVTAAIGGHALVIKKLLRRTRSLAVAAPKEQLR